MISVEKAIDLVRMNVSPLEKKESKELADSLGYILSRDIHSPIDMPPFKQSAMDGYALCLHDESMYSVLDEIKAGDGHHPILKKGEAARIFTGAPVPDTANAIVIQEKVTILKNDIRIEGAIDIGANIRPMGEQVKKGAIALKKGTQITAAAMGYLTSLGLTKVDVYKKPSVAIIVTGSELVNAGQPLLYGSIYESNSIMLMAALKNSGYSDVSIHQTKDDFNTIQSRLKKLIGQYELVLLSGGISVGKYDYVGEILEQIGVNQIFYKVNQKPGKPLFFGKKGDSTIFALPGNPAAALTCYYLYVYPALELISGNLEEGILRSNAIATTNFVKRGNRAQFLKAIVRDGQVTILEGQSSAMLQTFALANALVYLNDEKKQILKGDSVEIISFPV